MEPKPDTGFQHHDISKMNRKKGSRRPILSLMEKLEIVYEAIVKQRLFKDIAKEYRVSLPTVGAYVLKAKKNPNFFKELLFKKELREARQKRVENVLENLIEKDIFIDSTKFVADKVR